LTQVLKAARPALHLQWELVPLMLVGQHHEPKHDSTNWDTKKTGSGTHATNWVRDLMSTVAAHLIRTRKVSSGPPCSDTTTCNMQPPCGLMMQWYEQPLAFRHHHILATFSKDDAETCYVVLQRPSKTKAAMQDA